jgi:hypothetical protein
MSETSIGADLFEAMFRLWAAVDLREVAQDRSLVFKLCSPDSDQTSNPLQQSMTYTIVGQ